MSTAWSSARAAARLASRASASVSARDPAASPRMAILSLASTSGSAPASPRAAMASTSDPKVRRGCSASSSALASTSADEPSSFASSTDRTATARARRPAITAGMTRRPVVGVRPGRALAGGCRHAVEIASIIVVPRTKSRGRRLLLSSCRRPRWGKCECARVKRISCRPEQTPTSFAHPHLPNGDDRTLDQSEGGISGPDLSPIRKRFRFEGRARSFSVADPPPALIRAPTTG